MASPKPNYPWFTHRFAHLGDSAPPVLLPGGPTQAAGTRRRVYIGDAPAKGYPPDPGAVPSDVYPTDTTMIGRNEGALDDAVNRAVWAVHEKVDSVGDRSALTLKGNVVVADTAPLYQLDLTDDTIWGTPTLDRTKLLFLGPVGSAFSAFSDYAAILDENGDPLRNSAFEKVAVLQAWTTPLGLGGLFPAAPSSLFVGGALSMSPGGYFPDGDLMGVTGYGVVADVNNLQLNAAAPGHWAGRFGQLKLTGPTWPAPWTGGPTSDGAIVGYCLFNYSLAQRIPQYLRSYLWKAFATVIKQDTLIGPATGVDIWVNHDILADLNPEYNWKNGDIVYRTTIALAPTISFDNLGAGNPQVFRSGSELTGGSWNWLKTTDDPTVLQTVSRLLQKGPDIKPCLELDLPSTVPIIGGHDGHFAFERLNADQVRGSVGYETIDDAETDTVTGKVQALPFANFRRMKFSGTTHLTLNQADNAFTVTAPGTIQLTVSPPAKFGGNGLTQLILGHDILEVYDSPASDAEPVGLWVLFSIPDLANPNAIEADLIRVDGEATGIGLPDPGYFKVLRPETSVFNKVWVHDNFTPPSWRYPLSPATVRVISPGSASHGLYPYFSYASITRADTDGAYSVLQRQNDGRLDLVLSIMGDGSFVGVPSLKSRTGFTCPGIRDYAYDAPKTGHHQISLPSGIPLDRGTGLPSSFWSYQAPTNSPPGIWYINDPGPLAGNDILVFPVHLPHESTIVKFAVQYNCLAAPTNQNPSAVLYRKPRLNANAWANGVTVGWEAVDALRTLNSMAIVSGPANYHVYGSSAATANDVVDNELHEYFVVVQASDTGRDRLHGIRISFTMPIVAPA